MIAWFMFWHEFVRGHQVLSFIEADGVLYQCTCDAYRIGALEA